MTAEPVTAEPADPVRAAPVATELAVDLFLVCGQVGGLSAAAALTAATGYAQAAEAAGFDGVWLAEHHFISYGSCPSAVALAAYLLGRTSRIRVGTAAAILSTRHPIALAEEAILLDVVSGGRFALGVGRGGPWVDLEVFGTGLPRYEQGFTESLDLLLRTLSGDGPVAADGPTFAFRPVSVVPAPVRPVPVWVAATSTATARTAAERGLPLLLGVHEDLAGRRAMLDAHAEHCRVRVEHVSAHLALTGDPGRVRRTLAAWLRRTGEYVRLAPSPSASRDIDAYADRLLGLHPPAPAARLAERLSQAVEATGVRRLMLLVEAAGDPAEVGDTIQELGSQVLPVLRGARS
ncbi:LLM class flavin-dependent oxidoreductase [Catellatospora tritici]|uniref:LLM class flavin-dependent oxidoreductase n=1 Tax=Catellatospora tritici TaxID=2851566 RepID=UPI001C2DCB51|nr:LLM class flavin-dependent oxidoreductase [Catellatospora tritici]MBV1853614.1 LLM class flavin-dependent oxidoreductase [Catellatospora tritici]